MRLMRWRTKPLSPARAAPVAAPLRPVTCRPPILGAVLTLVALGGCASDATHPATSGDIRATLVAPGGPVSAAVLEITGVTDLTPIGGRVFVRRQGDTLRAVFILDTPGALEFDIRVRDVTATPAATVVEVANADNEIPSSLDGYHVRFTI